MIHETTWPEGTPAWVDIMVPDQSAAEAFYGPLFGWEFDAGTAETDFYTVVRKHGQPVAGLGQARPGAETPPVAWTTYLAVDDAAGVTERAAAAGATVLLTPMDVLDFGRMAVLSDPTGAVFGLWQSGAHTGANLVNEPGAVIWNEALSHDLEAARAFYGTVFGYRFENLSGPEFEYVAVGVDDSGGPVCGLGGMGTLPDDVPAHWRSYFAVSDTDATTARAVELGGAVVVSPFESPYGRVAVLRGPAGELFNVMSTDEPESSDAARK